MKLYKYIKKEYAIKMMKEGEVRIGTLYDFRKQEHIEIGDKSEGTKKSITDFPGGALIKDEKGWENKLGHLKWSNIRYVKGVIKIEPNTKFIGDQDVTDAYIYCASQICDLNLKMKFSGTACIEICDPGNFSKEILRELVKRGLTYDFCFSDRCSYVGHVVDHTIQATAHFLKDPDKYMHQAEYRFVFPPVIKDGDEIIRPIIKKENGNIVGIELPRIDVKIVPINITCKEAVKYCVMK